MGRLLVGSVGRRFGLSRRRVFSRIGSGDRCCIGRRRRVGRFCTGTGISNQIGFYNKVSDERRHFLRLESDYYVRFVTFFKTGLRYSTLLLNTIASNRNVCLGLEM